MITLLAAEFHAMGKCVMLKTLESHCGAEAAESMKFDDGLVHILPVWARHKYLGRKLCADPSLRTETELKNRIAKGWGAYAKHRHVLANTNNPLQLRMLLFGSRVTPTALFALPSLTLSATQYACLARARRKMLRNIIGWVRIHDEPWDDTRTRMRTR
eukprot:16442482-Heterocapsa_arctica.AAC.2